MDNRVGFYKYDLNNTGAIKRNAMPRKKKFNKFFKSRAFRIAIPVLVVLLLLFVYTGVRAYGAYGTARKLMAQAATTKFVLNQQDIVAGKAELEKTQVLLEDLEGDLNGMFYLRFIPVASWYYNDARHGIAAAHAGVNAGITTTDALIPYADVLGLKGGGNFTGGSAEDRIRLAVKSLGKVVPKIDEIEKDLVVAQQEIDQINPNHYPSIGKLKEVKAQIASGQELIDESVAMVQEGKPLIKVLPELLGEKEQKKYLVLFQNDKELRPTGGFLTYYAIFNVNEGVISVDKSSDIYDLDNSISNHPAAPPIIAEYLPKVNEFYIRDSNLSPDFVTSMDQFNELYDQSGAKVDVDGIIALDTHFLVSFLKILDGVEAGGQKFTADIDPECNCPQAVYLLELNTTKPVGYVRENRKSLLGELLFAIMQKSLASSPKEYWGKLFQQSLVEAQNKHIVAYLYNKEAQKGIEALNWGGRIKEFDGDYIHINDANFGGAKSNLFVRSNVLMDYEIADDGTITKTVTITYRNPEPHSDCNLERGGLCLNATLRNFQRVYVPEGSVLENVKGSEVKTKTTEDLGKTAFESFLTVKPEGKAEITYTYKLPFKVTDSDTLPVLIQKQPGTDIIPYEIKVNGEEVEKFDLISDKQLNLEI